MVQAGACSAEVQYFKAVKEMGIEQAKAFGRATVEAMKRMPTDDGRFDPGSVARVGAMAVP